MQARFTPYLAVMKDAGLKQEMLTDKIAVCMLMVCLRLMGFLMGGSTTWTLSNNVARQVIARVANGGLQYQNDGVSPPVTADNWDLMDFSLMNI